MRTITFHPVANLFPIMDSPTFQELRDDIQARGLLTPIWLHKGQIIDGRNRYRACMELGIEPQFREWDQHGSLVDFVVSLNLRRRHLSATQRAMVAYRLLPVLEEEAKKRQTRKPSGTVPEFLPEQMGDSRDQAAAMVGVSGRYVSDAKRVAVEAPYLLEAMEAGTLTLQGAKRHITIVNRPKQTEVSSENRAPMHSATDAIKRLSEVKDNDPQFLAVMLRVQTYVGNRIRMFTDKGKATVPLSVEEQFWLF